MTTEARSVKELFSGCKKVIILYLTINETAGHWVCLFKNKTGLNYFDSFGVLPDYQFELLTKAKRKQLHEEQDYF